MTRTTQPAPPRPIGTAYREGRFRTASQPQSSVQTQQATVYEQNGALYVDVSGDGQVDPSERVEASRLTTDTFEQGLGVIPDGSRGVSLGFVGGPLTPPPGEYLGSDSGWVLPEVAYADTLEDLAAVAQEVFASSDLQTPEAAALVLQLTEQLPMTVPLVNVLGENRALQLQVLAFVGERVAQGTFDENLLEALHALAVEVGSAVQGAGNVQMEALFSETLSALRDPDALARDGTSVGVALQALAIHQPAELVRLVTELGVRGEAITAGGVELQVTPFRDRTLLSGLLGAPLEYAVRRDTLHEHLAGEAGYVDGGEARNAMAALFGGDWSSHHVGIWPERDRDQSMTDLQEALNTGAPVYAELDGNNHFPILLLDISDQNVTFVHEGTVLSMPTSDFRNSLRHYAVPDRG